ncbi:MAG: PPK2 family polyphosphate kinase [Alphaproteobacteria bacterium]|nr:PPK2 family polyphosphate kinase [Alphaproteobacteria bacterium]
MASKTPAQPGIADVQSGTRVDPGGKAFRLADRPTRGHGVFAEKAEAKASLEADAAAIDVLQDALFAAQSGSLLVVLQGIDTSGKDGTVKAVFRYTSPLGVRVHPFGRPTDIELAHDYLWRVHQMTPRLGHIAVFNRSHYEDVLVVKVRKLAPPERIDKRYEQINQFEKMLAENGTRVLKLMLHVSKDEQAARLKERLEQPQKRWKFNPGDLEDRKLWDDFQAAYQALLERCSTPWAPWHVVPADSKTRRDAIAARLVRGALEEIDPQYPDPGHRPEQYQID